MVIKRYYRRASVGTRLALIAALLLVVVLVGMAVTLTRVSSAQLVQSTRHEVETQQKSITDMVSLFDYSLQQQVTRFLDIFADQYSGKFTLDPDQRVDVSGRSTPVLKNGIEVVNDNTWKLDRYTKQTGMPATVFARDGDDFVRVSTSLKDGDGKRAMGTLLDRKSASYAQLLQGKPYTGLAKLFGTPYITKYQPVTDADGQVVGALFVGVDITEEMAQVQDRIRQMGIGEQGYTMLVSARPGDEGKVLAGGPYEGRELMALDEASTFAPILEKPSGRVNYMDASGAQRDISFTRYPNWQWVVVESISLDEVRAEMVSARNQTLLIAVVLAVLLSLILYWLARRLVTQPLTRTVELARALSEGDLSQRIETRREDEIGQLVIAMNGIGDGLEKIVGQVRDAVDLTEAHTRELAAGNADLSARTDSQAAGLEQTAASTEEISATVRQNTQRAQESDDQARHTSAAASDARDTVEAAVAAMQRIDEMARQIGDVVGIIDGIAFQTNLLALNASVEAARAGEQGRGFAVVAQEVRGLAERSANSAREIKALIDRTAVEVENGNLRAAEAGERVTEIVGQIGRITTLVSEIRLASEEQTHGIEQINAAISQIDESTQGNAALVRQSHAATRQLGEQSRRLAETVSLFRLREGADHRDARRSSPERLPAGERKTAQPEPA
ncbi:methyl-accepting chemotaxis protein [Salinicola rhizosphaerae]|uniref:Methyl-accepting chemotaxis protein n=1 Tax=Salinicola rhizosphaerae TaxID=1443141 RepID=A0ABQ3EA65_9GAMM|nr:methyl-accepting chemotaxis protein [Salinicola rhizosphaerae]GHB27659.1 methyl-accepting chemotaxis protein [Salinicola rhizosphaerae]